MFSWLFGKQKDDEGSSTLATLDKLNEVLESLEKKEHFLQKKAALQVEKAREATRAKNKKAAIQFLKRKKMYEVQIEQLGNFQLRIHDQMILLEGAKATTETVAALRTAASAMKDMQKATNMDDVEKTIDDISGQADNIKQIQDALAGPLPGAEYDEDELEAELLELEGADLGEEVLSTPLPAAAAVASAPQLPTRLLPQKAEAESSGDEELEVLQKEMAL